MSPYPIADTHTHLYFPSFDRNQKEVIERAEKYGVKLQVQIGCDEMSSLAALKLAETHDNFYATLGLHPTDVEHLGKPAQHRISGFEGYQPQTHNVDAILWWFEDKFQENKNSDKIVGFGETGFDFYHNDTLELRELQADSFLGHIKLARKFERALVVHTREARDETLDFLEANKDLLVYKDGTPMRGVIHCFTEDLEFARIVTQEYGFFIGIGGIATYPKTESVREVIRNIPLEYIVTETDAPFLVPQGFKNQHKINEPSFLTDVVELIAEQKNRPPEATAEILFHNAKRLFALD